MLARDRQRHLGHQALNLQVDDAAGKLVASADFSEGLSAGGYRASPRNGRKQAVDFGFRYAMMPARGLDRFDLAFVNPLLQCGITDAQHLADVANGVHLRLGPSLLHRISPFMKLHNYQITQLPNLLYSGARSDCSSGVAGDRRRSSHAPCCTTRPASSTMTRCGQR